MSPESHLVSQAKHATARQPECGGGGDGAGVVVFGKFRTKFHSPYTAEFWSLSRKSGLVPLQACR